MTLKQDILKRLLDEKLISFEEMIILNEKEYVYYNNPVTPLLTPWTMGPPWPPVYTVSDPINPYTITSTSTTAEVK